MKKQMNRIVGIALIILCLAAATTLYAASSPSTGLYKPDFKGFKMFPAIEGFDHPDIFFYSWGSGGFLSNPLGILSSLGLLVGTFILRLCIMVMDFGMHPTFLNGVVDQIMTKAQANGWPLVKLMMPIVVVCCFYLFSKDYIKGAASTAMKRGMIFLSTLCLIGAAFAMPATSMTTLFTGVAEFSNWMASKVVIVFSDDSGKQVDQANRFMFQEVWEQLVYKPFETGEFAQADIKLDANDVKKINKVIDPYRVVEGQRWGDVALWFSVKSDQREDILDIYADHYPDDYEYADDSSFRFIVGSVSLITGLLGGLFLLLMGVILLLLALYFMGLLVAGILILPFALIPSEQIFITKYLSKILGIFGAMLYVNLYIAAVLIIIKMLFAGNTYPFLVAMFLVMVVLVGAIILFFVLLSKMQTVPAMKHVNEVMKPATRAGERAGRNVQRRYKRARNERRQDKRFEKRMDAYYDDDEGDEDEDDYNDDDGENDDLPMYVRQRRSDRVDPSENQNRNSLTRGGNTDRTRNSPSLIEADGARSDSAGNKSRGNAASDRIRDEGDRARGVIGAVDEERTSRGTSVSSDRVSGEEENRRSDQSSDEQPKYENSENSPSDIGESVEPQVQSNNVQSPLETAEPELRRSRETVVERVPDDRVPDDLQRRQRIPEEQVVRVSDERGAKPAGSMTRPQGGAVDLVSDNKVKEATGEDAGLGIKSSRELLDRESDDRVREAAGSSIRPSRESGDPVSDDKETTSGVLIRPSGGSEEPVEREVDTRVTNDKENGRRSSGEDSDRMLVDSDRRGAKEAVRPIEEPADRPELNSTNHEDLKDLQTMAPKSTKAYNEIEGDIDRKEGTETPELVNKQPVGKDYQVSTPVNKDRVEIVTGGKIPEDSESKAAGSDNHKIEVVHVDSSPPDVKRGDATESKHQTSEHLDEPKRVSNQESRKQSLPDNDKTGSVRSSGASDPERSNTKNRRRRAAPSLKEEEADSGNSREKDGKSGRLPADKERNGQAGSRNSDRT